MNTYTAIDAFDTFDIDKLDAENVIKLFKIIVGNQDFEANYKPAETMYEYIRIYSTELGCLRLVNAFRYSTRCYMKYDYNKKRHIFLYTRPVK